MNEYDKDDGFSSQATLEDWVMHKCDQWRHHYETTYSEQFDEYYRLWRGQWSAQDRLRNSERSRLVNPALQQAVESAVAEVEEATFGRGKFFDIRDDFQDQERNDIAFLRSQLTEDFEFTKVRKAVAECILNAAVFGTGIGEIVLEEAKEIVPASQPVMGGEMTAIGVNERTRFVVKINPVMPQNFLIDPIATSVETALGVAVDEYVPYHQVKQSMDNGIYRDVDLHTITADPDLEPDQIMTYFDDDRVRLTKYYGLVPRDLFNMAVRDEEQEIDQEEVEEDADTYVEAIVVVGNGDTLLKVEANPYMMQDRPIVAFPWDVVPSRFWGRGICEKGYNSQKALDTELRARIDALALTVHPMMAIDASRMPRGASLEIRPGKTFLTNGNPAEILQPFKFGQLDQVTFAQAQQLQQMVQTATGAIDAAGIPGSINGDATAAGISMSLGAIIKRHKRTLINFQESFLIPFVEKAAHRYMQFVPELYPVQDYKFVTTSSLGIIAREYEVTQLVQLLQTMSPDSPMYPLLIESIVENMNLSNREEIIAKIQEANQPDPQMQELQQQQMQLAMAKEQATLEYIQAQTAEIVSRTQQNYVETELLPVEEETKRIAALSKNMKPGLEDDIEFQRRAKVAELMLKEREIMSKEQMVNAQMRGKQ